MHMLRRTVFSLLSAAGVPLAVQAAACPAQDIAGSTRASTAPPTVEVLGLHAWTRQMLQDSVRRRRPGTEFGDAACALILRDSLHFADAAVWRFRDGSVVLAVVEPGDSTRVRYDDHGTGIAASPAGWDSVGAALKGARWSPYGAIVASVVR